MRENFLSDKSDVLIRMFSGAGRNRSNSTGTAHVSGTRDSIGQVREVVKKEFIGVYKGQVLGIVIVKKHSLKSLIGTWETADQDSQAIIQISEKLGKPHVVVFDKSDGEKFKVSQTRFQNGELSFEAYVPSNKYRTRHRLRLKTKNVMKQELTLIEKWVRVASKTKTSPSQLR